MTRIDSSEVEQQMNVTKHLPGLGHVGYWRRKNSDNKIKCFHFGSDNRSEYVIRECSTYNEGALTLQVDCC